MLLLLTPMLVVVSNWNVIKYIPMFAGFSTHSIENCQVTCSTMVMLRVSPGNSGSIIKERPGYIQGLEWQLEWGLE